MPRFLFRSIAPPAPPPSFNPEDWMTVGAWYRPDGSEALQGDAIPEITDRSTAGNDGIVGGGTEPLMELGTIVPAYHFAGSNKIDTDFVCGETWSITLAFKATADTGQCYFSIPSGFLLLYKDDATTLNAYWVPDGSPVSFPLTLTEGNWYVITLANDGTTFRALVNGESWFTTSSSAILNLSSSFTIGAQTGYPRHAVTDITDILISTSCPTDQGIVATHVDFGERLGLTIVGELWDDPEPVLGEGSIVRVGSPATGVNLEDYLRSAFSPDYTHGPWAYIASDQNIYNAQGQKVNENDAANEPVWKAAFDRYHLFFIISIPLRTLTERPDFHPLNSADDIKELRKGGDSIIIAIGPVGDQGVYQQFVLAYQDGGMKVLRQAPVWPEEYGVGNPYTYSTPAAGDTDFEDVSDVTAQVSAAWHSAAPYGGGTITVAFPWTFLHLDPQTIQSQEIPLDIAIIQGDPGGQTNVQVDAWFTKEGPFLATWDRAAEARPLAQLGVARLFNVDPETHSPPFSLFDDVTVREGPGVPIEFTLTEPKIVSINVLAKAGNSLGLPENYVIKQALRVESYPTGTHTIYIDGRTRENRIMPPADYRVVIGTFDGLTTHFRASAGNSGRPPYRDDTGLGSRGGVHIGPWAIGADSTGIIFLSGGEEGMRAICKIDLDGFAQWFYSAGGFGQGYAACSDGTLDYLIQSSGQIIALNAETGDEQWKSAAQTDIFADNNSVNYLNAPFCVGLVAMGGKVYFTGLTRTGIGVLNTSSHAIETDIPLSGSVASGLCIFDSGHLLTCIGTNVVKITISDGTKVNVITGLNDPTSIAKDASGNYYVSDIGTSLIYKYNSSFSLIATFGVSGGSDPSDIGAPPTQTYNPLKWSMVSSICIGPDGNLWCAERRGGAVRRFFCIDSTTGAHIQDYLGPTGFASVGFNQSDFSRLMIGGRPGPVAMEVTVDYESYLADPDSSLTSQVVNKKLLLSQDGQTLSSSPDYFNRSEEVYGRYDWFTYEGLNSNATGKNYLFKCQNAISYIWVEKSGNWQAAAMIGDSSVGGPSTPRAWYDANNNGLVNSGETIYPSTTPFPDYGYPDNNQRFRLGAIGHDLTLYSCEGSMSPVSINSDGVPNYESGTFVPYLTGQAFAHLADGPGSDFWRPPGPTNATDGSIIAGCSYGPHWDKSFHDDSSLTEIIKFNSGEIKWIIGKNDHYDRHNGDITSSIQGIAGVVDDVLLVSDFNSRYCAFDTNYGLSLGWLTHYFAGPSAIYTELASYGQFLKNEDNGERLLLTMTTEDVRVLSVSGAFDGDLATEFQNITLSGTYPASYYGLPSGYASIPRSSWIFNNPNFAGVFYIGLNDHDQQWNNNVRAIRIFNNNHVVGEIRLRTDAGQLCMFADILDTGIYPGLGSTSEASIDNIFATQCGIELMVGTGNNALRTGAEQGDTRIFFTTQGSANVNGLYRGVATMSRPNSINITGNADMRAVTDFYKGGGLVLGSYFGTAPTGSLNYSSQAQVVGSAVAAKRRIDKQGWVMHAEFPLAYLPDITSLENVHIVRPNNASIVEERPELTTSGIKFNIAIHRGQGNGTTVRIPWVPDTNPATNMNIMNPSQWGFANDASIELIRDENGDGIED